MLYFFRFSFEQLLNPEFMDFKQKKIQTHNKWQQQGWQGKKINGYLAFQTCEADTF